MPVQMRVAPVYLTTALTANGQSLPNVFPFLNPHFSRVASRARQNACTDNEFRRGSHILCH
jgi:hypothetical protein